MTAEAHPARQRRRPQSARRGLALAAAALLVYACDRRPAPEPPGIGGWTGEPQVAARIEEARQRALDEPEAATPVGRLGMVFHAHELHSEAIVCYRRAAELAPDEPRWPYLAALAMRKQSLEESVGLFEEAAARGIDQAAFHVNFGAVLAQLGQPDRAEAEYRRALELDAEITHALLGLAQLALTRSEPEAARGHLERAAAIAPWHGEVRTLLAQTYQRLGRSEDAEREFQAAGAYPEATRAADPIYELVEAEAVTSRAYAKRAQLLARAGEFAAAETLYRQVLEIRPGSAGDYSNLGGALAGQGKLDEAVELYRTALELDPNDPYAHNNLAMALARKGLPEEAGEHLAEAVRIEPAYPEAHHNLGLVRAGQGRLQEAVEHYRRALYHNPSLTQAHNDLGSALAGLGDLDGAIGQWREALAIDPRELSALYNLSLALGSRGEHQAAVDRLRQGLALAPNSSRLTSLLAWELATAPEAGLRDGAEALRLAQRVHQAYPGQPAIGDVLAAALAETGDFEAAIATAERAAEQAQSAGQGPLALQIQQRLEGYRLGVPFRQP